MAAHASTALITGGTSGIGRAVATKLAQLGTKPVMNSFTYMRSEGDCVWQIPFEHATLRDRRFIGSKAVHRVMLIFQDLEASTQSASIRTGVNEMMTRFVQTVLACCPARCSSAIFPEPVPAYPGAPRKKFLS